MEEMKGQQSAVRLKTIYCRDGVLVQAEMGEDYLENKYLIIQLVLKFIGENLISPLRWVRVVWRANDK